MKRTSILLLVVVLCSTPAAASALARPKAPKATVSATTPAGLVFQTGKLIFSTWEGEEFDDSFPPISWPHAIKARSDSDLSLSIHTSEAPDVVEIRMWKRIRANGIPRGEPHLIECYFPALPDECALVPAVSPTGISWTADFEPAWAGHIYVATAAGWPSAQVAWINHLMLRP